jgi:L-threonylcarbamoyladenylate synthase
MTSLQETQDHKTLTQAVGILRGGGIVVLPTDTVYGIVASALIPTAVERVFELRKRDRNKAVIVLIPDETALEHFSIRIDERARHFLHSVWPGKVSVILPTTEPTRWTHIHRGTDGIAFRVPSNSTLCDFLKHTGPLIAPSANIAGEPAATTIDTFRSPC